MKTDYTTYMRLAIKLAQKAEGMTSPNPLVGAVIIDRKGKIIGKGFHARAGGPHAEVMALRDAGKIPAGSTMIVTLEPCNHFGRTPPCTHAIQEARIAKVVIAGTDPNPGVKGGGAAYLRKAGIGVMDSVCPQEAARLNEAYFKHVRTSLPFISLKLAMSLDGRIAAHDGSSKWITSAYSRKSAHRLRNIVDAVVVGAGTVEKDNPQLTVRQVRVRNRPLYRVIFDTHLRTPVRANVITNQSALYKTIILTASRDSSRIRDFEHRGAEVVTIRTSGGRLSLQDALNFLGKRFMHILIEGGAGLAGSFVKARQVDKFHIFIAPRIIGADGIYPFQGVFLKSMNNGIELKDVQISTHGGDCLFQGYPRW